MAKKSPKNKDKGKAKAAEVHEVTTIYTFAEFKKLSKYISRKRIRRCDIIVIVTYLLIAIVAFIQKEYLAIAIYLIFIPLVMGGARLLLWLGLKAVWRLNKDVHDLQTTFTFRANDFRQKNKFNDQSYKYRDLAQIIETPTNFYLMTAQNQGSIVKKSDCDAETIRFLQTRIDQLSANK